MLTAQTMKRVNLEKVACRIHLKVDRNVVIELTLILRGVNVVADAVWFHVALPGTQDRRWNTLWN